MRRRALALLAIALLTFSAGCAGLFGGGSVPDSQLDKPPAQPYAWDSSADVDIVVTERTTFRAVYRVPANRSQMELYRRDGFGGRNAIPVRSVRYRYPNGTVINGSQFDERGGAIRETSDAVVVEFPNATADTTAQLAFTSESTAKRFSLPTFREGSYEVTLPPDRRVDFLLFGNIVPRGYEEPYIDDQSRLHIRWESVTADSILVQFYLQRDLGIFGALVGLLALIAGGGAAYYLRQIRELRERREEVGPDVDTGDGDFGDGPPPGMG